MRSILDSLSVLFISPLRDENALLMWCVFLAVVGVWLYLICRRAGLGRAIRALEEALAFTPESAKSEKELGKGAARGLRARDRLIKTVPGDGGETKYYLPEENLKKAAYFKKAGTSPLWQTLLGFVGLYLVLVLAYYFLPDLIEAFSKL